MMKKKLRLWLIKKLNAVPNEDWVRYKQISDALPNIKDSDKNEGTDSPWWAIIIPRQIMRKDPHEIASCIVDGVWFSRESAEAHLNSRWSEYGSGAIVYCFSGYWSAEYKQLLKGVNNFRNDNPS